jgi:hypothetical protein
MNDRETRCLFNKYRRIDVTLINHFFHFCVFCAFARMSFHSTSFARLQTYLTKWCREFFFSSNSFDSDVMIMRLIKIFDVHDRQFMFKQRMSDKMIEWWKKKTTKKCYFMFKIIRSYFHIRRIYSFLSWSLIYVFDIVRVLIFYHCDKIY